jgi:hypothetical protein
MPKKKNQKPTTNHVVQKQVDTSQAKKPKPTQVPPTQQKEKDNNMKIIAYTDNPTALKNGIDKKINDNELKTWQIEKSDKKEVLYSHTPEQWNEKAMPKPKVFTNKLEFDIKWWDNKEPDEATKGCILGRFVEILMVHFRDNFTHLEIK